MPISCAGSSHRPSRPRKRSRPPIRSRPSDLRVTPARPRPRSDALRETLAYYRDLGVAELYLDERLEEHEEISNPPKRPASEVAALLQPLAREVSGCIKCRLCRSEERRVGKECRYRWA